MNPVRSLLVAGSGIDALFSAFALRRLCPELSVRLLLAGPAANDPAGESVTPLLIQFLCRTLGIGGQDLHSIARPTWTLGAKLLWGGRGSFFRSYDAAWGTRPQGLAVDIGYLAAEEGLDAASPATALMAAGKLFPKDGAHGFKPIEHVTGLNFRPGPFAALLRRAAEASGVEILEGDIVGLRRGDEGLEAILLADGRELTADLFIDATGAAALLTENEWISFDGICTRAATLLRRRGSEPIRPFATIETHDAGWRWRIEHDDSVGMGIAWHPDFMDDDAAKALLLAKAPDPLEGPHFADWKPGRRDAWHRGVFAVGDACGFVQPLTAMRLPGICLQLHRLKETLDECDRLPGPQAIRACNRMIAAMWEELRDFVAAHYRFNTASDSPFWRMTRGKAVFDEMEELIALYRSIGPSIQLVNSLRQWPGAVGIDGWIGLLLGLGVPFSTPEIDPESRRRWKSHVEQNRHLARQAVPQELCLAAARRQPKSASIWGAGV